jgi:[protein-PII] uridylyltransferase
MAFRLKKAEILAEMAASNITRGISAGVRRLTEAVDAELQALWLGADLPKGFALAAVGGYGRGELFPHSDVDVLVLTPDALDAQAQERVSGFITACWDAGLEIGSSVRSTEACLEEAAADITVQTSLLEARHLAGDGKRFREMHKRFVAGIDPQAFFTAKLLEMQQRHTKFEDTPYSLEPNCKESPGGLRDLQVVLWVARAAGFGKTFEQLGRKGLATAFEVKQIKTHLATLNLIRARLHIVAGRREDRLVFDLQTALAESLGHVAQGGKRASEALMRRYYWAAKAVAQLNQVLMLNIQERLNPNTHEVRPINERFGDKAGMLEVLNDDVYRKQPSAILETFLLYQQTVGIKGLSARTLRALYNARTLMDAGFRANPLHRQQFVQILMQPQGQTHAFRLMNQTSVLGRYLWVFRRIVGQMQHDLFHVYTVDQHILMVLRNMRRFFMAEHAHEYPLCSQLAAGWDKPHLLYIAALFHDIAKGRGGDHSELGVAEVRRFCKAHGINRDDTKLCEFLVEQHLSMSRVAQKEDLGDPDVIRAFAQRVGSPRNLTGLYLLTVADVRGTSPKVWNAWKGKLLEDLYRYTLRTLGGRTPDASAIVEHRKREALKLLALASAAPDAEKTLWATLEVSYFMRHTADDLAWHVRQLGLHVGAERPIVRARPAPVGEGLQVLVYAPDVPDLFARICGYFAQCNLSILDARVHTARRKVDGEEQLHALDTFMVVSPDMADHYRELIPMIEVELARWIAEVAPLEEPRKARMSRRVKSFPFQPRVELKPDEKAQRWLLNVSATDRVGLLYAIARVLAKHRVNLQLAKVTTLGERVDDTFLIDGSELQHNKKQIEIEQELLEAVST